MKIINLRVLKGPNYWSIHHKVIVAQLDIGEFEDIPSNQMDGFHHRIQQVLPGLHEHYCSEGRPGGFLDRVMAGTWIGHIVEHIALELQSLAEMPCNFGKTRNTGQKGIYNVVFSFEEERAGLFALDSAVRIAEALAQGIHYDVFDDVEALKKIAVEDKLGPSTTAIINAALSKGIPYLRLDTGSLVQLGYGNRQKRIEATITEGTSNIAVDLASDKHRTKQFLKESSIPVPAGSIIADISELGNVVNEFGFPLVTKPYNRNQGKGVTINIKNYDEAQSGFEAAKAFSDRVIVEEFIPGDDYRLLVVNTRLVAAARRVPAMVTGNDHSTIRELVDMANQHPSRGYDHENILTIIRLDESTEDMLRKQHITLDAVPPLGKKVFLKQTANLSQGGTAEDVTDLVHPEIAALAERAARIIGLDICGIDLIAEDISQPVAKGKAVIVEVNAAPGFRMHTNPAIGHPRPVGEAVVDMLFHGKYDGRIPIVAITGTNGKTTTARLLAHLARKAGYVVGLTTTEGIYINGTRIEEGDCTGATSSQKILRDKSVNFAVLECARGGILRSGLGFDKCDTGIVTNVAEDHIGLNGIWTIQEMAEVKAVVPESVKPDGLAILNENNEFAYRIKDRLKCAVALFSINSRSHRIVEHCKKGGIAAFYEEGKVILMNSHKVILSEYVEDIPIAFGGRAPFMIENILAAILAAYFNRIDIKYISEGLHSFVPSYENTPGRLNHIKFRNFNFILDYAHNMHGLEALSIYLRQIHATQKVGIISAPGDRRESDIIGIGKAAAEIFDIIIIRIDEDPRDKKPAEIADLLRTGIKLSRKKRAVEIIEKETDAITHAFSNAIWGSLIVLFSENVRKSFELITELKNKDERMTLENVVSSQNPYVLRVGKNNLYEYTKRKAIR